MFLSINDKFTGRRKGTVRTCHWHRIQPRLFERYEKWLSVSKRKKMNAMCYVRMQLMQNGYHWFTLALHMLCNRKT